jgi:GMP reductase
MLIENEIKLDFKDVLIRPKRSTLSSRKEVSLERTFTFRNSKKTWTGVPIMAANMDGVGTIKMADELSKHNMFTCLIKTYSLDDISSFVTERWTNRIAVSTGTSQKDKERLDKILSVTPHINFICIDVANGYSEHFGDFISYVRDKYPNHTIIAGNVVTADMTQELILRGADIIKIGIGPGAVCTTRTVTGVGFPQLSAIIECADAAHGLGAHIIADGGCTCPGDVAKAFGAGADFVMLGSMLAGHSEGGGEIIERSWISNELNNSTGKQYVDNKSFIQFYGMSSDTAMNKYHGGVAEYRSSEGRTVEIPYRGEVVNTVLHILGGLRSACTYIGAPSLKQFSKCTTFIRVNRQINDTFAK